MSDTLLDTDERDETDFERVGRRAFLQLTAVGVLSVTRTSTGRDHAPGDEVEPYGKTKYGKTAYGKTGYGKTEYGGQSSERRGN